MWRRVALVTVNNTDTPSGSSCGPLDDFTIDDGREDEFRCAPGGGHAHDALGLAEKNRVVGPPTYAKRVVEPHKCVQAPRR